MEMIRKQIYIEARQEALLKQLARDLKLSEAELIRQGIDRWFESEVQISPSIKAWEEIKSFILRRMALGSVKGKRRWVREDVYEK